MKARLIALTIMFGTVILPLMAAGDISSRGVSTAPREATLEECLQQAFQNNHLRPASQYTVAMAEAQHRQALAAYWPQITAKAGYQRLDEAPNFKFPASTINVMPGMSVPVPAQDIKLMDPESYHASIQAGLLLYDGGMRQGTRQQTEALVDMMKQEARRTDLEVADSVRRYYYGAVLAAQLHRLGTDTLARMQATLNLTETMYKEGSGKVKKTDWLDNKVMVEGLRSMVAQLEKNENMAQAALANSMGMPWSSSIKPSLVDIPFTPFNVAVDELVSTAYAFNPDWAKIEAGLRAAEGAVRSAGSGHHPKLAVFGDLHKWWNDYDAGMATDNNKEGWSIGVGIEIPIFSGFLTQNQIAEARARVAKIRHQQLLLKEGIGLQVKDILLSINAAQKSHQANFDAMTAAIESRDLNTRAYQNELVDTEKVIRAQLSEALMTAQYYKVSFDCVALQSQLYMMVGTEVLKRIEGK